VSISAGVKANVNARMWMRLDDSGCPQLCDCLLLLLAKGRQLTDVLHGIIYSVVAPVRSACGVTDVLANPHL
jgi:hypothetical protein